MIGLNDLGALISDPELRALLKGVITRKINADLKTLQAHSELSKRLARNRRTALNGENDELRQILREHLDYYGTLIDLSHDFHQRLIDNLARTERNGVEAPAINGLTLALKAPIGATVRAPFKISNNRPEPISVTCRASPFVSEDGSQLIASRIAFSPPSAEIAPGAEEIFETILPVGTDFVAGRLYLATLSADGVDAMSIVVRLQVEAAMPEAAPRAEPAPVAVAPVKKAATRSKAAKANTKKAAARPRVPSGQTAAKSG